MKKNKKVMMFVLALVMAVTMPGVARVKAKTVTTPVSAYQCAYTLYVRKSENNDVLGYMRTTHSIASDKKTVYCSNKFTADTTCDKVTVYASYMDGNYATNTQSAVRERQHVSVTKTCTFATETGASNSKTYGKCKVTYN